MLMICEQKRQDVGKGNRFVVRPYNGQVRPMCALDPVVRAVLRALLGPLLGPAPSVPASTAQAYLNADPQQLSRGPMLA
ncbi:hypothetical protein AgCh_001049 [Apium graveolens]